LISRPLRDLLINTQVHNSHGPQPQPSRPVASPEA
jgi:hypothetical protein